MNDKPSRWWRRAAAGAAWVAGAFAVLVLALIAGGGGFWLATHLGRGSSTSVVPDLVGLGEDEALRIAEEVGVVLEVVDERHDPAMRSRAVLAQDPPAGSRVRRGRKVRIVRSLGGERIEVPRLAGEPAREVEIRIRQQGLAPGDEARVFARTVTAGTVMAQVPSPGTIAGADTRVHRLVSDGPVPVSWVMPDLTGLPLPRAESWMETCGFRKGPVRRRPSAGSPAGVVMGQLPLSGHPIANRGLVELTVSE